MKKPIGVKNLEEDFKATSVLLGQEKFSNLVSEYMAVFPPRSPTANDLGRNFAGFILLHELSSEFPFLFDLATFEWSLCESLYLSTNERADASQVEGLSETVWSLGRVHCHPSLKLFRFEWPVDLLWKTLSTKDSGDPVVVPVAHQQRLILTHGFGEKSFFHTLTESQFRMLRLLQQGLNIESALEQAGFTDPVEIQNSFAQWMSWGIFLKFDFSVEGCD
jgi:hypothetical protein